MDNYFKICALYINLFIDQTLNIFLQPFILLFKLYTNHILTEFAPNLYFWSRCMHDTLFLENVEMRVVPLQFEPRTSKPLD